MNLIDSNEAADLLGIEPRQVRNLAAHGGLAGRKVGGVWLISEESVRARRRAPGAAGRPISPEMAWMLLAALGRPDSDADPVASVAPDRQVRWRLRSLLRNAPPAAEWAQWLRRRADRRELWVHREFAVRLAADDRLVRPHVDAVLGLKADDLVPAYVSSRAFAHVVADYRARVDEGGVQLMEVAVDVGGELIQRAVDMAGLVDLVSCPDARVAARAVHAIDVALERLLATGHGA